LFVLEGDLSYGNCIRTCRKITERHKQPGEKRETEKRDMERGETK